MQSGATQRDKPESPPERAPDLVSEQRLLVVVGALARELQPRRRRMPAVTLDSDLERDLGFDSLGRAELLLRIERAFKVRPPERLLGEAETPRDLLEAVVGALAF